MLYRIALGEVLKEERLARNLRLRDASARGYIALGYLSEVERGQKEISSEPLENLARGLGIEPYEIIFKTAMKMAGVEIPDSPAVMLDEYQDLMVR
jgi:transcriptional regulator with XRE-family HTH domain